MQEQDQITPNFPERIYQLAREHQVGVPVKVYRPAMFWWFIGVSVWIAVFAIFLPIGIHEYILHKAETQKSAQFYVNCQTCTQADRDLNNQVNASMLSDDIQSIQNNVAEIVIGLFAVAFLLYARQKFLLYRCSEGLLFSSWKKKTFAWRWNEIVEVYWSGNRICSLRKADSQQVWSLTHFRMECFLSSGEASGSAGMVGHARRSALPARSLFRPLSTIGLRTVDGIPYLAPEIQLLYKAKEPRSKDEADFASTLPYLNRESRQWLVQALTVVHPNHPWLVLLEDH
jgi:hypothetical protein